MAHWIRVAATVDCPPGTSLEVVAGDRVIALFNVGGEYYALDGVCPHQGGPLGEGALVGPVVTCPWHGWQFDVRTGRHKISPTVTQPQYDVRVEAGWVLVDVPEATSGDASHGEHGV